MKERNQKRKEQVAGLPRARDKEVVMVSEANASSAEGGTVSGKEAAAGAAETETSRRALLKGLGVAAAGAVVGAILSPREAQAHGGFHQDFNGAEPAIHGNNTSVGPGVHGESALGVGVRGDSVANSGVAGVSPSGFGVDGRSATGTGVFGSSNTGPGMKGQSSSGTGVEGISVGGGTGVNGESNSGVGVEGFSPNNTGVLGRSDNGPGLGGVSDTGFGVVGFSNSGIGVTGSSESLIGVSGSVPNGMGVEGRSPNGIGVIGTGGNVGVVGDSDSGTGVLARNFGNGLALDVHGPAKFSTAGAGTIPAQQSLVVVNDSAVTADSHITMTLTGDPGSSISGLPAVVVWIERQPGTGFIARLSRRVASATPFTYLIVEPG